MIFFESVTFSAVGGEGRSLFQKYNVITKDIFETLQLTIICYQTKEGVRGKKLQLYSINCCTAVFFKVLMVNHGFCNGEKVKDLKNAILGKILV